MSNEQSNSMITFEIFCKYLIEGNEELQLVVAKVHLLRMLFDWYERGKIRIDDKKSLIDYVSELEPVMEEQTYDLTLQWIKANDVDGELAEKPVGSSIFCGSKLRSLVGFFLLNLRKNPLNYMQLYEDCDFLYDYFGILMLSSEEVRFPFNLSF